MILQSASDSEVLYRSLVALGTVLHAVDSPTGKWALQSSSSGPTTTTTTTTTTTSGQGQKGDANENENGGMGLLVLAKKIKQKAKEPRIQEVVGEIEELAVSKKTMNNVKNKRSRSPSPS